MRCHHEQKPGFLNALGHCQWCMDLLTVLSVLCWIVWWFVFKDDPQNIPSLALLLAGFASNALLFLHLWMRFVIFPWQRRLKRQNKSDHPSNNR